jgi:hypothetical protein
MGQIAGFAAGQSLSDRLLGHKRPENQRLMHSQKKIKVERRRKTTAQLPRFATPAIIISRK